MHWGMEWHVRLRPTALSGRLCIFYTGPDNVRPISSKPNLAAMI